MGKITAQKISLIGIMLGLVLLFQFFEKFFPFGFGFVNLNISLLFVLVTFKMIGLTSAIVLLILRFIFGPLLSEGFSPVVVVGHIILFVSGLIGLVAFSIFNHGFKKWSTRVVYFVSAIGTMFFVSLLMATLNTLVFTPWFLAIFKMQNWTTALTLGQAEVEHENLTIFYFGIENYYLANMVVYFTFNIVNFMLIFVFYYPLHLALKYLTFNQNF